MTSRADARCLEDRRGRRVVVMGARAPSCWLLEKQKEGNKRMKMIGRVEVPGRPSSPRCRPRTRPGADAFRRAWVERLGEDVRLLFAEALASPEGAVGRGPQRYYVEIHPERLRGFAGLATHPWVQTVAAAVLGADYQIVEVGFDVPLQGALNQPWHRDFPSPPETRDAHRHGMFPPEPFWPRYEELAQRKMPQMGDLSARSALTIHRGTKHDSPVPRPVLVLGMLAPGADASRNDLVCTKAYYASLPEDLQRHLAARLVDGLTPLQQKHSIEGLVMGAP